MSDARAAMFYDEMENEKTRCSLCPHNCMISNGLTGLCGVRKNIDGKLYAMGYGRVSSIALDPVEKKPLRMFHPGKNILSIGGFGCNLRCPFCQNSSISIEYGAALQKAACYTPEQIAAYAKETIPGGNIGAAYTYNEPHIGYEFVYDCAMLVRDMGLSNVLVTNGYINREPLEKLLPYIDAMNIDLKGFTESFYKALGGELGSVKETIMLAHQRCHVEITTLIIPDENDNDDEIAALAEWIASLDPDIPLHLGRFFPRYKYSDKHPTSPEAVRRLRDIARSHLNNVYTG